MKFDNYTAWAVAVKLLGHSIWDQEYNNYKVAGDGDRAHYSIGAWDPVRSYGYIAQNQEEWTKEWYDNWRPN